MIHFVGFRRDEYWSAVRIWGKPDFIHRQNDRRMRREIALPDDIVVFANGTEERPSEFDANDLVQRDPPNGV